jgi:hypothetical protein
VFVLLGLGDQTAVAPGTSLTTGRSSGLTRDG